MLGFALSSQISFRCFPAGPADATPKGKAAKAKAANKRKGGGGNENPKAVYDVRKAKLSSLATTPFPVVDRSATKELLSTIIMQKAAMVALKTACVYACSHCVLGHPGMHPWM